VQEKIKKFKNQKQIGERKCKRLLVGNSGKRVELMISERNDKNIQMRKDLQQIKETQNSFHSSITFIRNQM
jgi:hypothetical protein